MLHNMALREVSGVLALVPSRSSHQSFHYETKHPHKKNWIGIYPTSGGGPEHEEHVDDSLAWAYATEDRGVVEVSTFNLPPGEYTAYFLAKGGYKWLASPIAFESSGPWGTLSIEKRDEENLTVSYSTKHANKTNWIGIYNSYGGAPVKQRFVDPSLTWDYAPEEKGTVKLDISKLPQGMEYRAFLLFEGGYKWLANPVTVFKPGAGSIQFITNKLTTQKARVGEVFEARLGGFLANPRDGKTKFARAISVNSTDANSTANSWVQVSDKGVISGKPPSSSDVQVEVEAIASDGSKAKMQVTIPVAKQGDLLVDKLTVLSFNLWFGGTQVTDFHRKQVKFISDSGADIVGLQESTGGHATRLAQALGWDHWQGPDVGIISRYPISKEYGAVDGAGSVKISLEKGQDIMFWNCHLGYTPYGPYDFCFDHLSKEEVLKNEAKSRRTPQIINIMKQMNVQLGRTKQVPIIFTGDFNAPSHLDWTDETRDLHCGTGYFEWPTSKHPVDGGLIDSFREVHKDPRDEPGNTWSPIYLDNNGRKEPVDRIDFIYHKGLETVSSEALVVGKPTAQPNHQNNEWPSDHAAVKSVFKIFRSEPVQDSGGNSTEKKKEKPAGRTTGGVGGFFAALGSLFACFHIKKQRDEKRAYKNPDDDAESILTV